MVVGTGQFPVGKSLLVWRLSWWDKKQRAPARSRSRHQLQGSQTTTHFCQPGRGPIGPKTSQNGSTRVFHTLTVNSISPRSLCEAHMFS